MLPSSLDLIAFHSSFGETWMSYLKMFFQINLDQTFFRLEQRGLVWFAYYMKHCRWASDVTTKLMTTNLNSTKLDIYHFRKERKDAPAMLCYCFYHIEEPSKSVLTLFKVPMPARAQSMKQFSLKYETSQERREDQDEAWLWCALQSIIIPTSLS